MEAMQKIKCLTIEDSNFPDRLRKLSGMPKKLYYIGNLPDPKKPAAAVVGARMCSPYGRCQAFKYARTMASYGVQIISGMARGIDAEGHKGALDTDTPTFAVLGSGVDVCYPNSNRWLYQRILEKGGGIISELPPGSPPVNWAFPARNRIISGLSDAVLVVEAKEQSGSLITANFALEHGHSVYALPGAVTEELSRGCNKLIFDGRHRLKMRCLLMSLQTVFIFPYFQQKELVIVVNRKKIMITDIAFFLSAGFRNSGSV